MKRGREGQEVRKKRKRRDMGGNEKERTFRMAGRYGKMQVRKREKVTVNWR